MGTNRTQPFGYRMERGKVIENEKVKLGGVEVIPSSIEVTSERLFS